MLNNKETTEKIWIWNHYATDMFEPEGGRHFWIAKELLNNGYSATVFCSNSIPKTRRMFHIGHEKFKIVKDKIVPFVFVKTPNLEENTIKRVINMYSFYKNIQKISKKLINQGDKPDVILASSVHPLTLVASLKIGKKFNIPVICEIRDLWPESIVAYSPSFKKSNLLIKILYEGEKWIYKNADELIFTWEGGKQYIIDKKWDEVIDLKKVHYINNGIDFNQFQESINTHQIVDDDLEKADTFKIIYTGSIGKVYYIDFVLDVAKRIKEKGFNKIKFLIYGNGSNLHLFQERVKLENITNVILKGGVSKNLIPYVLSKADLTLLHNRSTILDKYGQSQNKLFDYSSAGKPILQTYTTNFSVIEKYNAGVMLKEQTVENAVEEIINLFQDKEEMKRLGDNAILLAKDHDFKKQTLLLIDIIKNLKRKGNN